MQLLQQVVGEYRAKDELQPVLFQNQLKEHQARIVELTLLVENKSRVIEQQETALAQHQPGSPSSATTEKEAEIRRLTHELEMREDTHATDLKIYKSRVDELLERNRGLASEKEAMAARYVEQVNALEAEVMRRETALRAAREQLLELENSQRSEQVRAPTPRENHSLKRQLVERGE